jgi:uncharacterized protein involved in type VI secretion and phage assembly
MRGEMEGLYNAIRLEITKQMAQFKRAKIGVVDSWDPEKHVAKVKYQPGDRLSGWIPVGTQFSGKQFGFAIGLTKGDQVVISYQEGSLQTGVISHRLWNDQEEPIKDVKSGEAHLVGKDKQHMRMLENKNFELKGFGGEKDEDAATFIFDANGDIVSVVKKGNYKFKADKGTFDVEHPKGDATFRPGSGKKVQVRGQGAVQPVMLADGSPSKVLYASKQ